MRQTMHMIKTNVSDPLSVMGIARLAGPKNYQRPYTTDGDHFSNPISLSITTRPRYETGGV